MGRPRGLGICNVASAPHISPDVAASRPDVEAVHSRGRHGRGKVQHGAGCGSSSSRRVSSAGDGLRIGHELCDRARSSGYSVARGVGLLGQTGIWLVEDILLDIGYLAIRKACGRSSRTPACFAGRRRHRKRLDRRSESEPPLLLVLLDTFVRRKVLLRELVCGGLANPCGAADRRPGQMAPSVELGEQPARAFSADLASLLRPLDRQDELIFTQGRDVAYGKLLGLVRMIVSRHASNVGCQPFGFPKD